MATQKFSPSTEDFSPPTEHFSPPPKIWSFLTSTGKGLYLWGGYENTHPDPKTVYIYSVNTETWMRKFTKGPHPPAGMYNGGWSLAGLHIYFYGGNCGLSCSGSLYQMNTDNLTWSKLSNCSTNGPVRKAGCKMITYKDQLIVVGGCYGPHGPQFGSTNEYKYTNEFHCYSLITDSWSSPSVKGSKPPPCSNFSLTMIDEEHAVMFGGYCPDSECSADIFVLHMPTTSWTHQPSQDGESWPEKRSQHIAVCLGYGELHKKLLISGGMNRRKVLNDTWLLDPQYWRWEEVSVSNKELVQRYGHSAAPLIISPECIEVALFGGRQQTMGSPISDAAALRFEVDESPSGEKLWILTDIADSTQFGLPKRLDDKRRIIESFSRRNERCVEEGLRRLRQEFEQLEMRTRESNARATVFVKKSIENKDTEQLKSRTEESDRISQELRRRTEESERRAEESDRRAEKLQRKVEEFDRMVLESEKKANESDRRTVELQRRVEESDRIALELQRNVNESNRRTKESDWRAEEADRRANESNRRAEGSCRRAEEADRRANESDRRAEESDWRAEEADRRANESDRRAEEADRRADESDRRLSEVERELTEARQQERERALEARRELAQLRERLRVCEEHLQACDTQWIVRREEIELTGPELGRGAWATVSVAKFRGLQVAAKRIHDQIVCRRNILLFRREMNIAARLRHPNLVQFIGATVEGDMMILMEFMTTSLRKQLETEEYFQPRIVKSMSLDVAKALNYLHQMQPHPIVHRDISSANILLEKLPLSGWKAKVTDYGSVNLVRQLNTQNPGGPAYAAPEANNPRLQSTKMDIFSYGALVLEMLTGQLPTPEDRPTLLCQVHHEQLLHFIRRCLSERIEDRPSAIAIISELELELSIF